MRVPRVAPLQSTAPVLAFQRTPNNACYAFSMEIRVNIPDELAAQIKAQGVPVDTYVRDLVEEKLSHDQADKKTRSDAVERMLRFAKTHGTKLEDNLKRTIHEGHKNF